MTSEIPHVEVAAAKRLADDGAVLLDVRELEEWIAGHAPGATHIPLSALGERYTEIPQDQQVVAICRSGARSASATDALNQAGFTVTNVAGGMQMWAAKGLAVVTDAGDPGTVI
ncbi:MAG: rhodanese-like domain-containing protein [Acidimicrobiales bacterium]